MSDIAALKLRREQPLFAGWVGCVSRERIEHASLAVRQLIDDIVTLGPSPKEGDVQDVVDKCVLRLNDLDDGWISTIEREDLCETIYQIVDLAGFEGDDEWTRAREF